MRFAAYDIHEPDWREGRSQKSLALLSYYVYAHAQLQQNKFWTYNVSRVVYATGHTPHSKSIAAAWTMYMYIQWRHSQSTWMSILPDYWLKYDKQPSTLPLASLEAQQPASQPLITHDAFHFPFFNASLWPPCVGPTVLTNPECQELVAQHIFYDLRVRTQTIKDLKIILLYSNVIDIYTDSLFVLA